MEPSLAGPKRPQDRVALSSAATDFLAELADQAEGKNGDHGGNGARHTFPASDPPSSMAGQDDADDGEPAHDHGAVAVEEVVKASASVTLDGEELSWTTARW